jgi:hypothetical protein
VRSLILTEDAIYQFQNGGTSSKGPAEDEETIHNTAPLSRSEIHVALDTY